MTGWNHTSVRHTESTHMQQLLFAGSLLLLAAPSFAQAIPSTTIATLIAADDPAATPPPDPAAAPPPPPVTTPAPLTPETPPSTGPVAEVPTVKAASEEPTDWSTLGIQSGAGLAL